IDTTVKNANTLIDGINEINQQVKHLETHGYSANDLYDRRDMMIDQLSEIVSINVDYDTSHMPPNKTGDGVVSINIVNESGTELTQLIDGVAGTAQYFDEPGKTPDAYTDRNGLEVISGITLEGEAVDIRATEGSLKGLIDAFGYAEGENTAAGDYPEMISKLDDMAFAMATAFNEVHGDPPFFEVDERIGAAGSISVAITEGSEINASSDGGSGNGENALALAAVFNAENDVLDGASVKSFYESVIGDLGVTAEHANKMTSNTGTLLAQVENQRLSVSAVSLDEEMSNMIKFQHAYSAAARSMTTMDELLDKIINNMGLVGR
ncbi:flagellar hook-associated protein FlgK, partial [Oceanobacillus massiliensis]|uniref:flagellar hook-associated protein FlgK n=1 Tax=Oceanobacillus massiliensis TaxID=1465765 RepID=UPI00301A6AC4